LLSATSVAVKLVRNARFILGPPLWDELLWLNSGRDVVSEEARQKERQVWPKRGQEDHWHVAKENEFHRWWDNLGYLHITEARPLIWFADRLLRSCLT